MMHRDNFIAKLKKNEMKTNNQFNIEYLNNFTIYYFTHTFGDLADCLDKLN